MSRLHYEQCPSCAKRGADSRRDNLVVWPDGGAHCFSCGYHRNASFVSNFKPKETEHHGSKVLPSDFSREVGAEGWKWLLQYGLPISYWKEQGIGYSETYQRLVFPVPSKSPSFSVGRYLGKDKQPKWKCWGEGHSYALLLGNGKIIVAVEDLISAHKLAYTGLVSAVPMFGTVAHPCHISILSKADKIVLWLDWDQQEFTKKKALRLQMLTNKPVVVLHTKDDPKKISLDNLKEILYEQVL